MDSDPNLTVDYKRIKCQCGFVFFDSTVLVTPNRYDARQAYACHVCKASPVCKNCLLTNHQHEELSNERIKPLQAQ